MRFKILSILLVSFLFLNSCSKKKDGVKGEDFFGSVVDPSSIDLVDLESSNSFLEVNDEAKTRLFLSPSEGKEINTENSHVYLGIWAGYYCRYYETQLVDASDPSVTEDSLQLICSTDVDHFTPTQELYGLFFSSSPETFCRHTGSSLRQSPAVETVQEFTCSNISSGDSEMTCSLEKVFEGNVIGLEIYSESKSDLFTCHRGTKLDFNRPIEDPDQVIKESFPTLSSLTSKFEQVSDGIWRNYLPIRTSLRYGGLNNMDEPDEPDEDESPKVFYGLWGHDTVCFLYEGSYSEKPPFDNTSFKKFRHLKCGGSDLLRVGLNYPFISLDEYKSPVEHCSESYSDFQAIGDDLSISYERQYKNCQIAGFSNNTSSAKESCDVTEVYNTPPIQGVEPSEFLVDCYKYNKIPSNEEDAVVEKTFLTIDKIREDGQSSPFLNIESESDQDRLFPSDPMITNGKIKTASWDGMGCIYYEGIYVGDHDDNPDTVNEDIEFKNLICNHNLYDSSLDYPVVSSSIYRSPIDHCAVDNPTDQVISVNGTTKYERTYDCTRITGFTTCEMKEIYDSPIVSDSQFTTRNLNCHNGEEVPGTGVRNRGDFSKDLLTLVNKDPNDQTLEESFLPERPLLTYYPSIRNPPNEYGLDVRYGLWGTDTVCFYYDGSYYEGPTDPNPTKTSFRQLVCGGGDLLRAGLNYELISLDKYKSPVEHCNSNEYKDIYFVEDNLSITYKRKYESCSIDDFPTCSVEEIYSTPPVPGSTPQEVLVDCSEGTFPNNEALELKRMAIVKEITRASSLEIDKILYRGNLSDILSEEDGVRFFIWHDLYCTHYFGTVTREEESQNVDHLECSHVQEYSGVRYHTDLIALRRPELMCSTLTEEYEKLFRVEGGGHGGTVSHRRELHREFECNIEGFEKGPNDDDGGGCTYTRVLENDNLISQKFECVVNGKDKIFGSETDDNGVRKLNIPDIFSRFEEASSLDGSGFYKDLLCDNDGDSTFDDPCNETVSIALWNDYYCRLNQATNVLEKDEDDSDDEDNDGNNNTRTLTNLYCSTDRIQTGEEFSSLENLDSLEDLCQNRTSFRRRRVRDQDRTYVDFSCTAIEGLTCNLSMVFHEALDPHLTVNPSEAVKKELTCTNYEGKEGSYEHPERALMVSFYDENSKHIRNEDHDFFYYGELIPGKDLISEDILGKKPIYYGQDPRPSFDEVTYRLHDDLEELDYAINLEHLVDPSYNHNSPELIYGLKERLTYRLQLEMDENRELMEVSVPDASFLTFEWMEDTLESAKFILSNLQEKFKKLTPDYPSLLFSDNDERERHVKNIHRYQGLWNGFKCHYTEYNAFERNRNEENEKTDSYNEKRKLFKDMVCFLSESDTAALSSPQHELIKDSPDFESLNRELTPYFNLPLNSKENVMTCNLDIPIIDKDILSGLNVTYLLKFSELAEDYRSILENLIGEGLAYSGDGIFYKLIFPHEIFPHDTPFLFLSPPLEFINSCLFIWPSNIACSEFKLLDVKTYVDYYKVAITSAEAAITNAEAAITNAETAVINAKTAVANAETAVADAETAVADAADGAEEELASAKASLATARTALTAAEIALANIQLTLDVNNDKLAGASQEKLGLAEAAKVEADAIFENMESIYFTLVNNRPYQSSEDERILATKPGISLNGSCAIKEIEGHSLEKNYRVVDWTPILDICKDRIETRVIEIPQYFLESEITSVYDTDFCKVSENTALEPFTKIYYSCRKIDDMECTLEKTYEKRPVRTGEDPGSFQSDEERNNLDIKKDIEKRVLTESVEEDRDLITNSTDLDRPEGTNALLHMILRCNNGRPDY